MKETRLHRALRRLSEQHKWIDEHGGTRWGYIERYGSPDHPPVYGDGGEAIWIADTDELRKREHELAEAMRTVRSTGPRRT